MTEDGIAIVAAVLVGNILNYVLLRGMLRRGGRRRWKK